MRLFMTDGMFGRCLEQIGPEFETVKDAMDELDKWKACSMIKKLYKVESYNRLHSKPEKHEIAIDFGDYSTFMLLTGTEADTLSQMT